MADKDQFNDEYHFSDPDEINPDIIEPDPSVGEEEEEIIGTERSYAPDTGTNVRRNAIIAVIALVVGFILFRLIASYFDSDELAKAPDTTVQPRPQPITQIPRPQPVTQVPRVQPAQVPVSAPTTDSRISERLTNLEANQQTLQNNVSSMNNQLTNVNTNLNELNAKVSELNQIVADMAQKMSDQVAQIESMIKRAKAPSRPPRLVERIEVPHVKYFVQAVIPGRAWLIGTNGTTLTVREGTPIPGYGVVKLIDSNQGQVLTSTGKTIRFSQNDS